MSERGPHDLVAAYALDALDAEGERVFERHLEDCAACRDELVRLRDVAAALGSLAEGPDPPPGLRSRVLGRVRAERDAATPRRHGVRRGGLVAALATATALLAAATAGLALWIAVAGGDGAGRDVLEDPAARVVALEGATGRVVVAPDGEAVLVVSGLPPLPSDRVYQLWVIEEQPHPAGLFRPSEDGAVVQLKRPVPEGATVAVTVEPAGGGEAPSGEPVVTARA